MVGKSLSRGFYWKVRLNGQNRDRSENASQHRRKKIPLQVRPARNWLCRRDCYCDDVCKKNADKKKENADGIEMLTKNADRNSVSKKNADSKNADKNADTSYDITLGYHLKTT